MPTITIRGQQCTIGTRVKLVGSSYEGIPWAAGREVTIDRIDLKHHTVGIVADTYVPGWHNFSGEGQDGHCLWINIDDLDHCLEPLEERKFTVAKAYSFGGVELKGKRGRVIQNTQDGVFVEMDEHIKGISCDGMGKKGHCALIPENYLIWRSNKNSNKKGKKREAGKK